MKALIWSKMNCSYCTAAKRLLNHKEIEFEERVVGMEWTKEQLLEAVPNAKTVPQIFLDGEYVGGYTELAKKLA